MNDIHFLIVDDFESIRVILLQSLRSLGASKISMAKSGNEAFKIIQEKATTGNHIQFIITDYTMADGSGLELVQKVRAINEYSALPILLLTSQSEINVVLDCIKAGAKDYIVKPWKEEELKKKILALL
ncbi:MAG: response regulator [Bacteriovoracaceae bacterium]|nr:response regulator [Bacteriovoracaceae bacterium]